MVEGGDTVGGRGSSHVSRLDATQPKVQVTLEACIWRLVKPTYRLGRLSRECMYRREACNLPVL